jgi:hypothetical protein
MPIPDRLHTVLAAELVNPPSRINDLLGTGIKRVASRTDVDVKFVGQRRLGLKFITATADDFNFLVGRMNIGLHCSLLDLLILSELSGANRLEGRGRITVVGITGKCSPLSTVFVDNSVDNRDQPRLRTDHTRKNSILYKIYPIIIL